MPLLTLLNAQWRKTIYLPSQVIKLFSRSCCFLFQGIYVSKIIAGGSAAATGKLRMGDRILAVNTTDIRNVTHQEAVMSLLQVNYFILTSHSNSFHEYTSDIFLKH